MENSRFDVESLRLAIKQRMDERRYSHTLAVEKMTVRLGEMYIPDRLDELICAALLHDITKNESTEKQLQYCEKFDIITKDAAILSPKLLHAMTAAALIPSEYPEYATKDIVSAVRWHTTGRCDMTLFDSIVYLADYIEDTRTFKDCVCLREYFFGNNPWCMTYEDRLSHLYSTMVKSVDLTLGCLSTEGEYIDINTVECRNYYLGLVKSGQA